MKTFLNALSLGGAGFTDSRRIMPELPFIDTGNSVLLQTLKDISYFKYF